MGEAEKPATSPAVTLHPVDTGFPLPSIPTLFADGAANIAPSANVIKFYLMRSDPEMTGKAEYKNQVFAQVVMPVLGFVQMAAFFESALNQFVKGGQIPSEVLEAARKAQGL